MRALRAVAYLTNALQVRTLVAREQFAAMRLPGLLSATSLMLLTLQGGIGGDMGQESSLHALPVVECPGCRTKMQVVGTDHAPNDQHSVTYRCNRCGTETVRVFKIPDE